MKKVILIIAILNIFIYAGQNMMGEFIENISPVQIVDNIFNKLEGN